MASIYYDSSGKNVTDGEIAEASDLNTINNAVDSGFQGVESDLSAVSTGAEFYAGVAEDWAIKATDVEPGEPSSKTSAASAAASEAQVTIDAAQVAADRVQTGLDVTQTQLDVTSTTNSAAAALASENKAQEWAEEAEDVPVEPGEFSAHHWAIKASGFAGSVSDEAYGPTWDGATTVAPSKNTIYDKFESLVKADVGLGNVDNTSDADKPVSTATQTALDLKSDIVTTTEKTSSTGASLIPTGTAAERPTPTTGHFRFNTDAVEFEGYDGTDWAAIGGGGGGGGLQWSVVSVNTTGIDQNGYVFDNSSAVHTLTLPATPTEGMSVGYKDLTGNFKDFPLTVDRNGSNIQGFAEDLLVDSNNDYGILTYSNATEGWILTSAAPSIPSSARVIAGAYTIGDIFGGELVYNAVANLNINPFSCMDDTLATELVKNSSTNVIIGAPPAINTIYHIFAVRLSGGSMSVLSDTSIDGLNLTGITHKRWLGFVLTNASSQIYKFFQAGDLYQFNEAVSLGATFGSTYSSRDLTPFVPVARCTWIRFTVDGSVDSGFHVSEDAVAQFVGGYSASAGGGTTTAAIPILSSFYFKIDTGTGEAKVSSVNLRR